MLCEPIKDSDSTPDQKEIVTRHVTIQEDLTVGKTNPAEG